MLTTQRAASLPAYAVGETGANCPCIKHFFPCTETSGSLITDVKGGVSVALPGLAFDAALGTIYSNAAVNAAPSILSSGAWHTFNGTESILVMYTGRPVSTAGIRFSLGDINTLLPGSTSYGLGLADGPMHTAFGKGDSSAGSQVKAVKKTYAAATYTIGGGTNGLNFTLVPTVAENMLSDNTARTPGTYTAHIGANGAITSVTIDTPGSGHAIGGNLVITPNPADPNLGIIQVASGWNWVAQGGGNLSSLFLNQDIILAMKYVPGVSVTYAIYDALTGVLLRTTDYPLVGFQYTTNIAAFTPYPAFRIANVKVYAGLVATFQSGFPANIDTYCSWMGSMWKRGPQSRVIHPGLIGVA
jgi:hypothetical protein